MAEHPYDDIWIEAPESGASVRRNVPMFFGAAPGDPQLGTNLLSALGDDLLHAASSIAPAHTLSARIDILGDRRITVSVAQPHRWTASDSPTLGPSGSLLGNEWWSLSALAALSAAVTVELWCDGRGFRQHCSGLRPLGAVQDFLPPDGSGTRVSLTLDPACIGADVAIPTELAGLNLHGPFCTAPPGPGRLLIRDHRQGPAARDIRYR
ncbi:hypothetical protein [Kitasatospora sp. NPDC094011]|uniref:hypothetical protein n=1 Tax=Kitasatospora sp. NPDC094011 TaxID=3364090 RepID=UPI00381CD054